MLVPVRLSLSLFVVSVALTLYAMYPGQDNPSNLCVVGDVTSVFQGNVNNHDGPYAGITMGC